LDLAASYNGFAFVIDGSVRIGDSELNTGQVGWLNRSTDVATSVLRVVAGESGARLVLYAGQPQGDPIVSYGPSIGDSKQDIARLFAEYQSGRFPRLSELKKQLVQLFDVPLLRHPHSVSQFTLIHFSRLPVPRAFGHARSRVSTLHRVLARREKEIIETASALLIRTF
jgi:Pirin C-terminal cupin domain